MRVLQPTTWAGRLDKIMATRKRHSAEQIVRKLMAADRLLAEGKDTAAVCRELGVSEATYHRWRNQFGGLKAECCDLATPRQPTSDDLDVNFVATDLMTLTGVFFVELRGVQPAPNTHRQRIGRALRTHSSKSLASRVIAPPIRTGPSTSANAGLKHGDLAILTSVMTHQRAPQAM